MIFFLLFNLGLNGFAEKLSQQELLPLESLIEEDDLKGLIEKSIIVKTNQGRFAVNNLNSTSSGFEVYEKADKFSSKNPNSSSSESTFPGKRMTGNEMLAWDNDWDRNQHSLCENGSYIRRITSIHDNSKEDRRWAITCGKIGSLNADQNCYWTNNVNSWDEMVAFNCPGNRIMTGMMSEHSNSKEDRLFRYRCCGVSGRKTSNCEISSYTNEWDKTMDFKIPYNKVVTGAFSYHLNNKEDRRWKFMVCDI